MKIAVNTRFLLKGKMEGIGWFTYEVLKRLVIQHPEIEFVFFFDRPYAEEFIFGKNVTPVILQPPARHPFLWYIWFEFSIKRALKKYQADIFLSPDGYCCLGTTTPTVMVTHDVAHVHYAPQIPWLVRHYYHYYVPRFLRKADQIVSVSEYTKTDIIQQYQIDSHKIRAACNGCKKTFIPLKEGEKQQIRDQYAGGKDYFFYLGALHPRKNVARLIEAFDRFKQENSSDIKLLIGGRMAWQTGAIKEAFVKAIFKEDIIFLGYIADEELPKILGGALALTYVSLFEGFGVPLLEAMYCEVPVITSNVSSMPEVVGKAGKLVDPKSIESIAEGMKQIYQDQNLRNHLIELGKTRREKFTWDKATDVVYQSILKAV